MSIEHSLYGQYSSITIITEQLSWLYTATTTTEAPPTPTAPTIGCPPGQLFCPDGTCIPESYLCDGKPGDCLDYYDESIEAGCGMYYVV